MTFPPSKPSEAVGRLPEDRRHADENRTRRTLAVGFAGALLMALCIFLLNPRVEAGLLDDGSYVYSAQLLAQTGHIHYNGWAAFPLGWQLYLGALAIKLFGFSFAAPRATVMLIGCLSVPLIHAVMLRFGVRPWNAAVGAATVVFSPLYIPCVASFMSDIPALVCLLVCLYACLRATQAESGQRAIAWLLFAGVSNALGGTVRQVAWLGVLVMVPATAWYLRRHKGMILAGIGIWTASFAFVMAFLHWFNHQPYVSIEPLLAMSLKHSALVGQLRTAVKVAYTIPVMLSPVTSGVAVWFALHRRPLRKPILIIFGGLLIFMLACTWRYGSIRWFSMLVGPYISSKGILDVTWLYGSPDDVIPRWVMAVITLFAYWAAFTCAFVIWHSRKLFRMGLQRILSSRTFWLLGPYSLAYVLLVETRSVVWDRYLLPMLIIFVVLLLLAFQELGGEKLSLVAVLPIVAFAAYGIAGTHDTYAAARARLQAANELRAAGVPKTAFRAGFEYDTWTEIEVRGFVNERRIRTPAGVYLTSASLGGLAPGCAVPLSDYSPSIHPEFVLSNVPGHCYPLSDFAPVHYRTWLGPHDRTIYIERVK